MDACTPVLTVRCSHVAHVSGGRTEAVDPSRPAGAPGEHAALTYGNYLALDEILAAQRPRSDEHDELLFIVIHQVYELWFKQLLHELAHLQDRLEDGDTSHAVRTLRRVLTILKVVVTQIDVLETMSPRQFAGFRGRLDSASGFQSAQFRQLEVVLGRRDHAVVEHYPEGSPARRALEAAMARPTLWESYLAYLRRAGYEVGDDERPRSSRCTATTAVPRSWRSTWSTSTRACRSGATGT